MSVRVLIPESGRIWEPRLDLKIYHKHGKDLPSGIRKAIRERLEELETILDRIEEVTDIEYPTIVLMPFAMVGYPIEPMIYFATVSWGRPTELGSAPFVGLSAPTLMCGSNKALVGLLLHELIYYVARSVAMVFKPPIDIPTFISIYRSKGFMLRLAEIIIGDKEMLRLYKEYERGDEKARLAKMTRSNWLDKGLPLVSYHDLGAIIAEMVFRQQESGLPLLIDGRLIDRYGDEVVKLIEEHSLR